jgi:hypothetical protein
MRDLLYLKRKEYKLPAVKPLAFLLLRVSLTLLLSLLFLVNKAPGLHTIRVLAQQANGIAQPASGETIAGAVIVQGTATDPNYLRYELAFFQEFNPAAGWIVFAEGDQVVISGTLAIWDTTVGRAINAPVFPDGRYQLRLRVVRTDYNYDEYFVTNLTVANDTATPTATPTAGGTAGATPAAPQAQATFSFQQPTPLPSLTPFPTPTPLPTPLNAPVVTETGAEGDNSNGSGGLLGQLATIEANRFTQAFWLGVVATGYIFAALALYLLLRMIARRLWRLFWTRIRS